MVKLTKGLRDMETWITEMGDTIGIGIGIGIAHRYFGLRYQVSVSVSLDLKPRY